MKNEGMCPRCGEHTMMTPLGVNALSRLTREPDDEPVWVCSDCGTDEGYEALWCKQVTPKELWPIHIRTFDQLIKGQNIAIQALQVVDDGTIG